MMLKWLIAAVIIYGGFIALLYLAQRSLQYFPERRRTAPSAVGLTKAEEVVLDTADNERVIVWHVPQCDGQPVFLYFHGNGGSLRWREERFRDLSAESRISLMVMQQQRLQGVTVGSVEDLQAMVDAIATNRMKPVIDRTFPFDQVKQAFSYLASGAHFGKVAISIG